MSPPPHGYVLKILKWNVTNILIAQQCNVIQSCDEKNCRWKERMPYGENVTSQKKSIMSEIPRRI